MFAKTPPMVGPMIHEKLATTRRMPKPSCRFFYGRKYADKASCAGCELIYNKTTPIAKRERANGAKDETKQDQLLAAELVGQCAAEHASNQTKQRRHPKQDARLSHADVESLCDIEGEEGEEKCASDAIYKTDSDDDPKQAWELMISFVKTSEHPSPFVSGDIYYSTFVLFLEK